MTVEIRSALLEDINQIAQIHVDSWGVAFEGLMPQGYISSYNPDVRRKEWNSIIQTESECVIVAERDQQVVGFLSYYINPTHSDVIELSKLYLSPYLYRQGVGTQLMNAFNQVVKAEAIKRISLYVLDSNQSAMKFYQKLGFVETGEFEKTEYDGETIIDIRLMKTLTS